MALIRSEWRLECLYMIGIQDRLSDDNDNFCMPRHDSFKIRKWHTNALAISSLAVSCVITKLDLQKLFRTARKEMQVWKQG
jgi:hypothetical protein